MSKNVGSVDRAIRIIAGIALLGFTVFGHGPVRLIGIIGIILIVTAIVRFCPAYWVMRIRTTGSPSN